MRRGRNKGLPPRWAFAFAAAWVVVPTWAVAGGDPLGIGVLQARGLDGDGVRVGVLDSGFRFEHEALIPLEDRVVAAWDFVDGDGDPAADAPALDAHGSRILATIAQVAPGSSWVLVRVEDAGVEDGEDEDRFVAGAEFVLRHRCDVVVVALGYPTLHAPGELDGASSPAARAVELLAEEGIAVVVAAGNGGPGGGSIWTPADAPHVLSVGATALDGTLLTISSRGPLADGRIAPSIVAPGEDLPVPVHDQGSAWTTASGTSFAAATMGGALALLRQHRGSVPGREWMERIVGHASRAADPTDGWGAGVPDLVATLEGEEAEGPPQPLPGWESPRNAEAPRGVEPAGGCGPDPVSALLALAAFRPGRRTRRVPRRTGEVSQPQPQPSRLRRRLSNSRDGSGLAKR